MSTDPTQTTTGDITLRLRSARGILPKEWRNEAADEIDRLRSALAAIAKRSRTVSGEIAREALS